MAEGDIFCRMECTETSGQGQLNFRYHCGWMYCPARTDKPDLIPDERDITIGSGLPPREQTRRIGQARSISNQILYASRRICVEYQKMKNKP